MRTALVRLLVVALAFILASQLFKPHFGVVPGAVSHHWTNYLIDAVAFGILNMTLGAILRLFTLPLRILTFGLFSIVINAVIILIMTALPASTYVRLHANFVGALGAAVLIAVVSVLADLVEFAKKHV